MYRFPPLSVSIVLSTFLSYVPFVISSLALGAVVTSQVQSALDLPVERRRRLRIVATSFSLSAIAHLLAAIAMNFENAEFQGSMVADMLAIIWFLGIFLGKTASTSFSIRRRVNPSGKFLSITKLIAAIFGLFVVMVGVTGPKILSGPRPKKRVSESFLRSLGFEITKLGNGGEAIRPVSQPSGVDCSWRTALLPFIDGPNSFEYNMSLSWNHAANTTTTRIQLRAFLSPGRDIRTDTDGFAFASYGLVCGPGTAFANGQLSKQTHDATIIGGECEGLNLRWAEPRDADTSNQQIGINLPGSKRGFSDGVFSSYWPDGGVNVLRADGSTQFLHQNADQEVIRKMLDPATAGAIELWR